MSRYTEKALKDDVTNMNLSLKDAGSPWQLEVSPRNNYCAVDSKNAAGDCHNVESGTPRECWETSNRFTVSECRRIETERLQIDIDQAYRVVRGVARDPDASYDTLCEAVSQLANTIEPHVSAATVKEFS